MFNSPKMEYTLEIAEKGFCYTRKFFMDQHSFLCASGSSISYNFWILIPRGSESRTPKTTRKHEVFSVLYDF